MEKFRITLAAARVNAGLTQSKAAEVLNINKGTLINWEKGRTSPKSCDLLKLCEIYDVSMNNIFLPDNTL